MRFVRVLIFASVALSLHLAMVGAAPQVKKKDEDTRGQAQKDAAEKDRIDRIAKEKKDKEDAQKKIDPPKFKQPEPKKEPTQADIDLAKKLADMAKPPETPKQPDPPKFKGEPKQVPKDLPKRKELPAKDFPEVKGRLPTESDAVLLALADLQALGPLANPFIRYIWVTDWEAESAQVVSLTLNYVSRASVIKRPPVIGKDKLCIVRVDLRDYAGKSDLNELVDTWEEFRFDPRFNLLVTKDTLKFATGVEVPKAKRVVQKLDEKGNVVEEKVKEVALGAGDVVRVPAPWLGESLLLLADVLQTESPIITHSYFITRALTTVQDAGVFKTVYGGLYYRLAGIKKGNKKGTDEDNLFESLGVGNVGQGITADKLFDDLRSDQRVAMFRSGITGHPRRVDVLRSLASREGQGLIWVTHDLKQQSIDIGQHPILNLLDFKDDARELIAEKRNGLHLFALFDGKGALQDEVPPDIASDHFIPVPHGGRLQPAKGCIICHGKGKQGGLQVAPNDVKKLREALNPQGQDKSKRTAEDDQDRIFGLYDGDLELKLNPRARDDYANAILLSTGPWKDSKDQTDVGLLSSEKIATVFNRYVHDLVSTTQLLRDFGIEVGEDKDAVPLFKKLLPLPPVVGDYAKEDARIGAMLVGLPIGRTDYDLTFGIIATRVYGAGK